MKSFKSEGIAFVVNRAARWLTTPPVVEREAALKAAERLGALTHIVAAAEHLSRPQDLRPGGVDDWEILKDNIPPRFKWRRRMASMVAKPSVTTAVDASMVAAGVVLLLPTRHRTRFFANGVLAAGSYVLQDRRQIGGDGSDHARAVCTYASTVARAGHRNTGVVDAALWALGMQSNMSYTISGVVKLMGPWWRQGIAVERIMRTRSYGYRPLWELATKRPKTIKWMSHSLVAMECLAPVVYLSKGRLAKPYAIYAICMHLSIAHTMALGRFVTSFAGMMSGLMYTAGPLRLDGTGGVRRDLAPKYAAGALGVSVAWIVWSVHDDRRRNRSGNGAEYFETEDGCRLAYNRTGVSGVDKPLIFLEAGVASPLEQYGPMVDSLAKVGEVVTYHRAGSGPSTRGVTETKTGGIVVDTVDDIATRAAELIRHLGAGRRCVLVSHAIGCYLGLPTASMLGEDLDAAIFVELPYLPNTFGDIESLVDAFKDMERRTRLGAGVLMRPTQTLPGDLKYMGALDTASQRQIAAFIRDPLTWAAAGAEIKAIANGLNKTKEYACEVSCPTTIIATQAWVSERPEREQFQHEMVEAIPQARLVIIDDSQRPRENRSILGHEIHRQQLKREVVEVLAIAEAGLGTLGDRGDGPQPNEQRTPTKGAGNE